MSQKKLKVDRITNELEGASLYFNPPPHIVDGKTKTTSPERYLKDKLQPGDFKNSKVDAKINEHVRKHESMHSSPHASVQEDTHSNGDEIFMKSKGGEPSNQHASMHASKHDDYIETIRKSVKKVGREELYVRLTLEEKNDLRSVVYKINELYRGKGCRTSENEISRIALKFLLEEYRLQGERSILAITEEVLNA